MTTEPITVLTKPFPRLAASGGVCCSEKYGLCPTCLEWYGLPDPYPLVTLHAASAHGELRTNCHQHEEEDVMKTNDTTNTTPPDPYAPGLAAIRAARATPQSRFAEQYATELRAAATTAPITAPATPRLTAAEMAAATPPDPYAPGLAALAQRRTAR